MWSSVWPTYNYTKPFFGILLIKIHKKSSITKILILTKISWEWSLPSPIECIQFAIIFVFLLVSYPLNREGALQVIVDSLKDRDVVVGTTGMLSRELFEYRVAKGHGHEKDFLTVGSMGHASAIALGIAQFKPKRQVSWSFSLLSSTWIT